MRGSSLKNISLVVALASAAACGDAKTETAQAAPVTPQAAIAEAGRQMLAETGELTPQELGAYRLDMDRVRAWYRVQTELNAAFAKDPSLRPEDTESGENNHAEAIRRMESNPTVAAALRKEGLTGREAVTMMYALGFSAMASEMAPGTTLPEGVSAANVEFVRKHRAELERLNAAAEAEAAAGEPEEESEEG